MTRLDWISNVAVPPRPGSRWLRYGIAVLAVGLALSARLGLDCLIGQEIHPYVTLYIAVALVAWFAGPQPALTTLALGLIACLWVVVPPRNSLAIRDAQDLIEILICLLVATTVIFLVLLTRFSHVSRQRAEAARTELAEVHVRMKTLLESISDPFVAVDRNWTFSYVNPATAKLLCQTPDELQGRTLWDLWPDWKGTPFALSQRKSLSQNEQIRFEAFLPDPFNLWLEVRGYPSTSGMSLFLTDMTARKDAEIDAARARETLAKTNLELEGLLETRTSTLSATIQDLEHFSYALGHDMRAPLRAMHGYAELLTAAAQSKFEQEAHDFCKRIMEAAERLDSLVTDSLNYTKILRQQLPNEDVDLTRLLQGIIESYPQFAANPAAITVKGELAPVRGNKALLTHCFSNLLDNALKFVGSEREPNVSIWTEQTLGRVRIWIEDNGIGIRGEDQQRIFGMFQQLNGTKGGTGVGLSIVCKAVDRMQGTVGVESEVGQGSRFWIELPAV